MDVIQWITLWALNAPAAVESRAHFAALGLPDKYPAYRRDFPANIRDFPADMRGFPAPASLTTLALQEDVQAMKVSYVP